MTYGGPPQITAPTECRASTAEPLVCGTDNGACPSVRASHHPHTQAQVTPFLYRRGSAAGPHAAGQGGGMAAAAAAGDPSSGLGCSCLMAAMILELDVPYEMKALASRLQRDYAIISNIPVRGLWTHFSSGRLGGLGHARQHLFAVAAQAHRHLQALPRPPHACDLLCSRACVLVCPHPQSIVHMFDISG